MTDAVLEYHCGSLLAHSMPLRQLRVGAPARILAAAATRKKISALVGCDFKVDVLDVSWSHAGGYLHVMRPGDDQFRPLGRKFYNI